MILNFKEIKNTLYQNKNLFFMQLLLYIYIYIYIYIYNHTDVFILHVKNLINKNKIKFLSIMKNDYHC